MAAGYQRPHLGGSLLSARVSGQLMREMKGGRYAAGALLPAEVELAAVYGVSRPVIRDALAELEREGFIERVRGVGTVIHHDIVALHNRLDIKQEYNDLIRNMGYTPAVDCLRLTVEAAGEELADRLQMDMGAPLLVCEKRLLAGSRPVIYSFDRVPLALFGDIDYRGLDWRRPVFDLLREACGVEVDTDIARICATNASPYIRGQLQVADSEALLFLDEVGYYKLTQPILQSTGFYTDFFEFTMLRKRFE